MGCPMCDRETEQQHRPFCSKRCADLDLAKWLNGSYAVPSQDPEDFEDLAEAMQKSIDDQENTAEQKPH